MRQVVLRPRAALLAAVLAAVLAPAVPAIAHAATAAELAQRAATLADAISLDWSGSLNQAGSIVDPLTGQTEGGYGRTLLAYGMVRATERNPALDLIPTVARALPNSARVAQASFNLLGLAEILRRTNGELGAVPTASLEQAVLSYPRFGSSAPTAPCYQRAKCYDNLKLVNATALLAVLAALPGQAGPPGTTFASPPVAAHEARHLLAVTIPGVEIPDGELVIGRTRLAGAALSDPSRDPTAYLALSAMMLGRGLELAGRSLPSALRAFQRAVVALLGLTAPNGDISYMGRGQGQVWTMASAAAACALALRLLPRQAAIRARCAGLIDTELAALTARREQLGGVGIAIVPRLTWTRGVDPYINRTDYNGLCVYALNLTADALQGLPDPREQVLPAAVSGERFSDAAGAGLATTNRHGLWFAVHRQNTAPTDSRWGFGLVAMQRLGSGGWTSSLPNRPMGPGDQGPSLIVRGHRYEPIGQRMQVAAGRIVIHGGWGNGSQVVRPATFSYEATAHGVVLSVPVQRGDSLLVREWTLPGQPSQVALSAAGVHEATRRRLVPLGNDVSDRLEQLSHVVSVARDGLVRVGWRG